MVVIARVLFYTIRLLTRLQVGASDSSAAVATKFGQRHGLTSEAISRLTKHIESRRLANDDNQWALRPGMYCQGQREIVAIAWPRSTLAVPLGAARDASTVHYYPENNSLTEKGRVAHRLTFKISAACI